MFQFESQGAVDVVTPEIALNHENIERFSEAFAAKSFSGQPMVVIDMRHVPLVDSAAMESLLEIQRQLRDSAGSLKLAGLTQLCQDIFKITGLSDRFEIYSDAKSAVGSFVR
ncbi:MAG: STAS domain-containing protein [Planctomycetota bacterium]